MAQDRGSGSRDGVAAAPGRSGGGGSRQALKKGPWTAAEDSILTEYVRKHGEGNWNTVQKNSGLLRCGKSCRLRWANHLRPNLKKGAFSAEEERLIIELHAKLGNKWARMASQLPGRTDNEIKNYWNTRVKRRLRAGLPIYPPDIQQNHHHAPTPPQPPPPHDQTQPNPSSSPVSSPFLPPSSLLSEPNFNPPLSFTDHINFPKMANPLHPHPIFSFLSNPNYQFKLFRDDTNGGFASPMSSYYSPPQFQPGEVLPAAPLVQFNSGDFGTSQTAALAASPDLIGSAPSTDRELPSIQSTVPLTPPTSSGNTGSDYTAAASSNAEEYEMVPELSLANTGLLEALLEESQTLTKPKKQKLSTGDRVMNEKEALDEMSCIDDDLSCLLDNFPLTVPVPNWYDGSGNV